ncbi:hypothetical protein [Bacillus thuringiensis]|uniref:hypothetical protein n=1 Tax=Bacillus thuringiensis TaxID=1428 RepID=UPI0032C48E60
MLKKQKDLQAQYNQLQQEYKQGTQALQRLTAQVSRMIQHLIMLQQLHIDIVMS